MYKIIQDGVAIGTVETPVYIKFKAKTGCNIPAFKETADGIAFGGKAYHFAGKHVLNNDHGEVMLTKTDAAAEIDATNVVVSENHDTALEGLAELGVMAAEGDETALEAIAELGAIVADMQTQMMKGE